MVHIFYLALGLALTWSLIEALGNSRRRGNQISLGYGEGWHWMPCGQVSSCMAMATSANFVFILLMMSCHLSCSLT